MPSIIAEAPTGESTALLSSGNSNEKRLYTSGDVEEGGTESFPRPPVKYFSKLWESYAVALEKNPLLVKAVTAFFILGLGDTAAQGVEALFGSNSGFDLWRAIRFGTFGFLGAPWAHYYYLFLDTAFPPTERPFTPVTIIKLVIDQGVQAPALLALIIAALALLKGIGIVGVKADLKAHYMNTLIANWILWLPASFLNMAFVKPSYRVLYVNLVFFFWTILLSILVNAKDNATQ